MRHGISSVAAGLIAGMVLASGVAFALDGSAVAQHGTPKLRHLASVRESESRVAASRNATPAVRPTGDSSEPSAILKTEQPKCVAGPRHTEKKSTKHEHSAAPRHREHQKTHSESHATSSDARHRARDKNHESGKSSGTNRASHRDDHARDTNHDAHE